MVFLAVMSSAFAEDGDAFVQVQADVAICMPAATMDQRVKLLVDKPLGKRVGVGAFSLLTPHYGEIVVGPSFYAKNLMFNVSIGLETAEMPLRGAVFVSWMKEHMEVFTSVEMGGSGLWYVGVAKAHLSHLRIGILTQRYDGVGPSIGIETHGLEVWSAPMYDYEDKATSVLAGLSWIP